jgi:hypothetical protein
MRPKPIDLSKLATPNLVRCPVCGETEKIESKTLQYELHRKCLACGNDWTGGMGVQRTDPFSPPPIEGVNVDADDDRPVVQFTGAGFRDPDKNYGGED